MKPRTRLAAKTAESWAVAKVETTVAARIVGAPAEAAKASTMAEVDQAMEAEAAEAEATGGNEKKRLPPGQSSRPHPGRRLPPLQP